MHFDKFEGGCFIYINKFLSVNLKKAILAPNWISYTKLSTLRALMTNIAISISMCSPKYLNKAFLVLNVKFFMQHETFIFKQFKVADFEFDTHSYSSRNNQTRCIGPNEKVTLFCWRYFIFIKLKLLMLNLSIIFWNSYSVTPTILSTFYSQVNILLDSGMMISGLTKNYNFNRNLL